MRIRVVPGSYDSRVPEGEPGDLHVGLRHGDTKRRHGEDLPGLRRHGEPAEALGRHVVQPAAAGRPVAHPADGRAGQRRPGPEEEAPAPASRQAAVLRLFNDLNLFKDHFCFCLIS